MSNKKFLVGVDAGRTNCRVAITDEKGEVLHFNTFDSTSYITAGAELYAESLSEILKKFLLENSYNIEDISGICIGTAGARTEKDKEDIKKAFKKLIDIENVISESDTVIAYKAAFDNSDGLMLICGTGSALLGRLGNDYIRLGGWGKILGDAGSCYFIGLNFLRKLVKYFDETDEISILEKTLSKRYDINRGNIVDKIYHQNFDIASLAKFVLENAENKNKICIEVLENEVSDLIELFRIFKSKYKIKKNFPVAFTGSLIENKNYFSDRVREQLTIMKFDISRGNIIAVEGALKLIKNKLKTNEI